jgi:hypothetical protein
MLAGLRHVSVRPTLSPITASSSLGLSLGTFPKSSPRRYLSQSHSNSFFKSQAIKMPTKRVRPAELLERNAAWCEEMSVKEADLLRENTAGQNPSILWIGCSDSRVPESVVAKCRPGDIFTHRNIAGQFSETDDSAMSVLTYAVEALGVEHGEFCSKVAIEATPDLTLCASIGSHCRWPHFLWRSHGISLLRKGHLEAVPKC